MPLGQFIAEQYQAARILQEADEPLSYEELEEALSLDYTYPDGAEMQRGRERVTGDIDDIMQSVMRGLTFNGAIQSVTQPDGGRRYTDQESVDIDVVYGRPTIRYRRGRAQPADDESGSSNKLSSGTELALYRSGRMEISRQHPRDGKWAPETEGELRVDAVEQYLADLDEAAFGDLPTMVGAPNFSQPDGPVTLPEPRAGYEQLAVDTSHLSHEVQIWAEQYPTAGVAAVITDLSALLDEHTA